jgi:hypothetical protein
VSIEFGTSKQETPRGQKLRSHLARPMRCQKVELRQALLWSGLLLGSQATDTLTTAVDRARGALESMVVSARLLEVGGIALFWTFKVLIVASAAAALVAAARSVRRDHRLSRITFHASLVAVQAMTICLACASLSNLAVLASS